ncbi:hypothetical protein BKP45_08320 [Anaerobacillus alkalidiazotrophicus]|uniref:Uncharacterized protein n=1 Tax=Anaerobacillus alkalidiazotrophicus TaxID=472963 RepID=A0A1S2M7M0_9BACI|nr:hypothetical protein BKP45_08320 [Anaerobacillus alkalidiazotrophicus]
MARIADYEILKIEKCIFFKQYKELEVSALREFIQQVSNQNIPTFETIIRENKTLYADAPESEIPVVLEKNPFYVSNSISKCSF